MDVDAPGTPTRVPRTTTIRSTSAGGSCRRSTPSRSSSPSSGRPTSTSSTRSGTRAAVSAGCTDVYYHRPVRQGSGAAGWTASPRAQNRAKARHARDAPLPHHRRARRACGRAYWSNLLFGTSIPEPLGGQPLADHAFPEDARSRPVGERSVHGGGATRRFATRALPATDGDMHVSDEAARVYALPAKILQGLSTFAMCSASHVVDGVAEGDPDRLRRLACRFSATTVPGNDVAVALYDAGEQGRRPSRRSRPERR